MALIQNATTDKTSFMDFSVSAPAKQSTDVDFEKVMQTTKDAPAEDNQQSASVSGKAEKKSPMKDKLSAFNSRTQEKLAASETEAKPEEALEIVGTLMVDIKELLMNVFQVSEEELAGVMTELNMTDVDLMNPEMINQLAIELTGTDAMELLFQPEFTDTLKNLNQEITSLKQAVCTQLDFSEKEVQQVVEQLTEDVSAEKKDNTITVQTDVNQLAESAETPVTVEPKGEKMTDSENDGNLSNQMSQQQTVSNPVLSGIEQAVEAALPEADAESVVRQLVEKIQVTVMEDSSSFEMQLNPEHLGKISLQVVAKHGAVTAQIATENAAVKEALESQIVTLKESLNNQGIEVEAVEVTIASHEFERNLDEHQEQTQNGEGSQKKRFRFDVMEASEEELTSADVIMRDMMIANGNQINYMA